MRTTKHLPTYLVVLGMAFACGDNKESNVTPEKPAAAPAAAAPQSGEAASASKKSPPIRLKQIKPTLPKSKFDPSKYQPDPVAPATFTVTFDTTNGDILIDVNRKWSPLGADRFYRLVTEGFYDDTALFKVIKGFLVQGGIHGDPKVTEAWKARLIPDEPVVESNEYGYITFASAGKNTRLTQFIIHLRDNSGFDQNGFTPFGKVRNMDRVESLFAEYGDGPPRGGGPIPKRIMKEGNPYLKADFPKLDYIKKATVLPAKK